MIKTHFAASDTQGSACGRGQRTNTDPLRVTCGLCQNKPAFRTAKGEAEARRVQAFLAQVPRTLNEPWQSNVPMVCKSCGGDTFRLGDRTCYGHYDNFHCASCGGVESRLTETGMSF